MPHFFNTCLTGQYPIVPVTAASIPTVSATSSTQNGTGSVSPRNMSTTPPTILAQRSARPTLRIMMRRLLLSEPDVSPKSPECRTASAKPTATFRECPVC